MCGIAGGVGSIDIDTVGRMCDAISYRGPDHRAVRRFGPATLGMVRLAIIDLAGGSQPIANETDDVWVVFNGEIYNYEELRDALRARGHVFRTNSDTETIVHAYEEYGDAFPSHLRGMFAIAVWDTRRERLVLVRDRLGEKPLYYRVEPTRLCFGSEVKSLLQATRTVAVDRESVATFLSLGYVPAPRTAFDGIRKLCPGEMAIYEDGRLHVRTYWSLAGTETLVSDYAAAVDRVDQELQSAVRYCLKSDVEVGAFLSGGLDSSLICAVMRRGGTRVRTYSIGFDGSLGKFSELPYAQRVATTLGTEHRTFVVTEQQAIDLVPRVLNHYDEPNGEPTSMLVQLLCANAVKDVKVALGGTGGDELFQGYPRHGKMGLLGLAAATPAPVAWALRRVAAQFKDSTDGSRLVRRAKRFTRALGLSPHEGYRRWLALLPPEVTAGLVLKVDHDFVPDRFVADRLAGVGGLDRGVFDVDTGGYLPEFQLTYMDRMSMACSLEVRSPLCDYRLAELAASLPPDYRVRSGQTKRILKDVGRRYLPSDIVDRKKAGFDAPIGAWFKRGLRPWLTELLDAKAVSASGLLDPTAVTRLVDDHLHGRQDYSMQLWAVVSLEHWYRRYIEDGSRIPVPIVA